MRVAADWDDTLVDATSQEWLPGAVRALYDLLRCGHEVVVHSCRAGWPEGVASIEAKLQEARLGRVSVTDRKPNADVFVDDRALRFSGDWPAMVEAIRDLVCVRPL